MTALFTNITVMFDFLYDFHFAIMMPMESEFNSAPIYN